MGMAQQTASTRDSTAIEYTIYTFQRKEGENRGPERWHKQDTLRVLPDAMKKAETLYESGQYCKVEVKQKYTDPKSKQIIDMTLKIFQRRKKRSLWAVVAMILATAFSSIVFAVTYYLGQH
jgi:hypothetical protein